MVSRPVSNSISYPKVNELIVLNILFCLKQSNISSSVTFFPGDDYARISSMLVDISFWALSYPYSNIIVLSKNIVRGTIVAFESLYNTHGLLLSKTEPDWLVPGESSTLFLTSLFEDPTGGQLSTSSQKQSKILGGGTSSQGAKRIG